VTEAEILVLAEAATTRFMRDRGYRRHRAELLAAFVRFVRFAQIAASAGMRETVGSECLEKLGVSKAELTTLNHRALRANSTRDIN
jgi:hypothetical protein